MTGTGSRRTHRPGRTHRLLLVAPAAFLALFFLYPLFLVLAESSADAWEWMASPYVRQRLSIAFRQAVASLVLTLALALPLAWLYHTRRIRGERLQRAIHAAPFVLPVFVVVYGLQQTLGPQGWLRDATGLDLLGLIGPFGAVVLGNTLYNYGFAARLFHAALASRPHRLEEAAQTLGASPRRAFLRVTVPLLLPSLFAVAVLVFLFCFASFGVVLFLGQGEIATLETMLYQNMGGVRPRADRAATLGLVQLGINILLLAAYLGLRRRALPAARPKARPRAGPVATTGAWALAALALVPPLSVLVGGFRVGTAWTLEPWRALLDADHPAHLANFDLGVVVVRSLIYAAGSAALALALCLGAAYGARHLNRASRRGVEALASLPLGTSSLLIGLGLLLAFGAGGWLDLRGSPIAILIAHTLVVLPFVARVLLPAIDGLDRRLDEAAAVLGATPSRVAWTIHRPLLAAPLAAALGFAAALSLADYGASLLLMRSDTAGLAVWIGRHDRPFDPLAHAQATALAGLLAVMAAIAFAVVEVFHPNVEDIAREHLVRTGPGEVAA